MPNQKQLIKFYADRLAKVKQMHNPNLQTSNLHKERCWDFINFAKKQLKAVKKGRNW